MNAPSTLAQGNNSSELVLDEFIECVVRLAMKSIEYTLTCLLLT